MNHKIFFLQRNNINIDDCNEQIDVLVKINKLSINGKIEKIFKRKNIHYALIKFPGENDYKEFILKIKNGEDEIKFYEKRK